MKRLYELPNIGKILEQKLINAGITNADKLKSIGAEQAFLQIAALDESACYNMLCAL